MDIDYKKTNEFLKRVIPKPFSNTRDKNCPVPDIYYSNNVSDELRDVEFHKINYNKSQQDLINMVGYLKTNYETNSIENLNNLKNIEIKK